MKAKLLKEQLGLPAGTELDVVSEGRAVVLAGPTGHIVVASEDVEVLPEKDPSLLVNILAPEPETQEPETQEPETQEPETQEPETQEPETPEPETPETEDDDLDEPLPDPQPECDGESCESCQ